MEVSVIDRAANAGPAAALASKSLDRCEVCGDRSEPIRPSHAWKIALVGAYAFAAGGVFLGVLSGLGMVVNVPLAGVVALGTLGPLHEKVSAPARCRTCNRYRD